MTDDDLIYSEGALKKRKKSNLEMLAERIANPSLVDESRKDALRDIYKHDSKRVLVDTCFTPDCGWETAIEREDIAGKGGGMVVVEEYPDKEAAVKGHAKWLKMVKENPDIELISCRSPVEWFFGVKKKKELKEEVT